MNKKTLLLTVNLEFLNITQKLHLYFVVECSDPYDCKIKFSYITNNV